MQMRDAELSQNHHRPGLAQKGFAAEVCGLLVLVLDGESETPQLTRLWHSDMNARGKKEMDRMFDGERAKLARPMTKTEFLTVVAKTLAAIRCGHTGLTPDEETQKQAANALMFPLRVVLEGRRLMVLFNDSPEDQAIRPG